MTRRILGRPCAALLFALLLGASTIQPTTASTVTPQGPATVAGQDADGDNIPDDMDPDDDNDGVPDSDQGGEGTSSGNDPLPDSDDDGITDDMDPDDNNNAVTDEDEPVPPSSGGNGSNSGSPSTSAPDSSGSQPLVKALPVTGSGGPDSPSPSIFAIVVAVTAGVIVCSASLRMVPARAPAVRRTTPDS